MTSGFDSPKSLLRHAKEDLDDVKATLKKVFQASSYVHVVDREPQTGHKRYKIKFDNAVPARVRYTINNSLNSFKHALDQALVASVEALSGRRSGNIYFPIRTSRDDLESWFGSRDFQDVPTSLYPVIRAFEPYPRGTGHAGGNDFLCAVCKIVGPNKHQVTIKEAIKLGPTFTIETLRATGVVYRMALPPRWDVSNNEMVLATVADDCEVHYDLKVEFYVAFGDPGPMLGEPIIPVLYNFAAIVERIVLGLEAETFRILRSRAT